MKKICWEKFNKNDDDLEGLLSTDYEDDDDENDSNEGFPLMMGPIAIPMNSVNLHKDYNLIIAHTNFLITPEIAEFLEREVEGIEALDILSPYRFRIAVGKLFNAQEVIDYITSSLTESDNETN